MLQPFSPCQEWRDYRSESCVSKMRLTPIQSAVANEEYQKKGKKLTLPQLQLLSTVIGVRAANFVQDQLKLQNSKLINSID